MLQKAALCSVPTQIVNLLLKIVILSLKQRFAKQNTSRSCLIHCKFPVSAAQTGKD